MVKKSNAYARGAKGFKGAKGHTGPIHAHRLPAEKGMMAGHDPSHTAQNTAQGLPPDMYGQGGEGYMEGPGHENCEYC